jgi:ABC-2 type transport system permease protein
MVVVWILICVVMPRIASSTASVSVPSAGKLETDFTVLAELRKLGDGHNANDPAFERLKKSLLDKYQVNSVDQLPINFRGVVASASEAELTTVLNRFAQQRMAQELKQAKIARQFGWLSPKIAIQTLSMISAGTSLETHHRFIRETENLRFKFVQSLNQAHIQQLNYQDDINRNKGEEEWQRARVDASNWQMIQGFKFIPDSPSKRIGASSMAFDQLLLWALVLLGLVMMAGRRPV